MPEPQLHGEPVEPTAQVTLRSAGREDCRRLWEWRNELVTRESSFNTQYIPYEDHERWFSNKIQASDMRIFIILDAYGREVGYVRFNILAEQAEISVSVDSAQRGRGYGPAAIRLGSEQILAAGTVKHVVAHVKSNNPASISAFRRAGFIVRGLKEVAGTEAYEMVYEVTPQGAPSAR